VADVQPSAAPFVLTLLGANQRKKFWPVLPERTEGPMRKLKQFNGANNNKTA